MDESWVVSSFTWNDCIGKWIFGENKNHGYVILFYFIQNTKKRITLVPFYQHPFKSLGSQIFTPMYMLLPKVGYKLTSISEIYITHLFYIELWSIQYTSILVTDYTVHSWYVIFSWSWLPIEIWNNIIIM